jgi:hypothetical protein
MLVPAQSFHDSVRTGDRIVPEEGDNPRDVPQVDGPVVLPIPDG